MIRSELTPHSPFVFTFVTPGMGAAFQRRNTGPELDTHSGTVQGGEVQYDVTRALAGSPINQPISFLHRMNQDGGEPLATSSKEGAQPPELIIETY